MKVFVSYEWGKKEEVVMRIFKLMRECGFEISTEPKKYTTEPIRLKLARSLLGCHAFSTVLFPSDPIIIPNWILYEIETASRYQVPSLLFIDKENLGYGYVSSTINDLYSKLNAPPQWYEFDKSNLLKGDLDKEIRDYINMHIEFLEERYEKVKSIMEFGIALELALHSENIKPFPDAINTIGDAFDKKHTLIYKATTEATRKITGGRLAFIGLLERGQEDWTQVVIKGFSGEYKIDEKKLHKLTLGFDGKGNTKGITGAVAHSGRPVLMGNIDDELKNLKKQNISFVDPLSPENQGTESDDSKNKKRIKSELCVPILLKGSPVGVIDIEDTTNEKFHQGHLLLLEWLARVVAIAYSSDQLESFIVNLSKAVDDEKRWMANILKSLMAWSRADYGFIAILDEIGKCRIRAIEDRGLLLHIRELANIDILEKGGLTKKVMNTGTITTIKDITQTGEYVPFWPDVKSEIAIPIRNSENLTVGVVDLEFKTLQNFDNIDDELYQALADLVLSKKSG